MTVLIPVRWYMKSKMVQLISVRGNPDHPMTRGGLCVKLKDYEKRHYHPERVLHPMRRVGPKGSGQFEQISWDDALTEITDRWESDN